MKQGNYTVVDMSTLDRSQLVARKSVPVNPDRERVTEEEPATQVRATTPEAPRVTVRGLFHAQSLSLGSVRIDYALLTATFILLGIGAVMVYSASSVVASSRYASSTYFLMRHLFRAVIGLGLLLVFTRIPTEILRSIGGIALLAGMVMLMVLLVMKVVDPSGAAKGAYRWFRLPYVSFQPSEFVKFTFIVFLAGRLSRQQGDLGHFTKVVLPHLVLLSLALGLILFQPDLSTAVAIALVSGVIMFAAGMRIRHAAFLVVLMLIVVVILIRIEPYRMDRLMDFWLVAKIRGEPVKPSYQIFQGFVALGSGGIFGRGLGQSLQKYFFLPEPHTDSILPVIGEEFGLVGTLTVLVLFAFYGREGMRIARMQKNVFSYLLAVGLTANIMIYATLNAAVMLGLLPATGLPLPFISYGGSALILNLASTGVLLRLDMEAKGTSSTVGMNATRYGRRD
jgi:cell division protein FtsW